MSILMLLDAPGASVEAYDRTNELLDVRGNPDAPQGLISHCCAVDDKGLVVADVWDSEAALNRFFEERLGAALAQAGIETAPPRIMRVHNLIRQGAGTVPGVLMIWEADGFTPEAYDAITSNMAAHVGDGSGHPAVSHVAATTESGMVFADIWDSPESMGRFLKTEVGPAAGGRLPEVEPRFARVHNRMLGA